jgi:hypothetical protein
MCTSVCRLGYHLHIQNQCKPALLGPCAHIPLRCCELLVWQARDGTIQQLNAENHRLVQELKVADQRWRVKELEEDNSVLMREVVRLQKLQAANFKEARVSMGGNGRWGSVHGRCFVVLPLGRCTTCRLRRAQGSLSSLRPVFP